jgi:phosphoenolpyruvate carboxykinase (ATP)
MKEFIEAPKKIYLKAKREKRIIEGGSLSELKEIALKQEGVILTKYGSLSAYSEPQSRVALKTKNSVDHPFKEEEKKLAYLADKYLEKEKIIVIDSLVGNPLNGVSVRFLIPEKFAQLAYGMKILFNETLKKIENPTYHIVFFTDEAFELNKNYKSLKEKDVQIRLFMGDKKGEQVKICRNSIYSGEGKKGVFQFENWRTKKLDNEGIFLHAGVRKDRFLDKGGKIKEVFSAIASLSGTGKTTLLSRSIAENEFESSEIVGDDGGSFYFSGGYFNFEHGGFYIKTENLDEKTQPELYKAVISNETFLENVKIKNGGMPDFFDTEETSNGRAIIKRENLKTASKNLDAPRIDFLFIISRNPLLNVISKLTPEQAVMQFIYGESVETSGGDPEKAGEFKREFFLDPFVAGNRIEHALYFYEFLKRNPHIQCFLINTGSIGENERDISLNESLTVFKEVLKGTLEFSKKPDILGYYYPVSSKNINPLLLCAEKQFKRNILEKKINDFLKGRENYLQEIEVGGKKIPEEIKNSLRWH